MTTFKTNKFKLISVFILVISLLTGCKVVDEIKKDLYVKITTSSDLTGVGWTSAILYGEVTDDGGKAITEKGIVFGKNPLPTVNDTKVPNSTLVSIKNEVYNPTGVGKIGVSITNLTVNNRYYYRAYCINSYGVSYGEEQSFYTKQYEDPKVTTSSITATFNSINVSGNLTNLSIVGPVVGSGFYYSETPGVKDTNYFVLSSSAIDSKYNFSATIPQLNDRTVYYVKAFVRTPKGVYLGNELMVKTLDSPTRTQLKQGLQVYFSFSNSPNDESTNNYSGKSNLITYSSDRFGNPSSALAINGNRGSRIEVPNYFGVTGITNRTFSIWAKIKPNSIGNHSHMFGYGGNPFNGEQDFGMFVSSLGSVNNIAYKPYIGAMVNGNGGGYMANQFTNIQDGFWHHYVLVVDFASNPTGELKNTKLYIDGKLVSYDVIFNQPKINTIKKLPLTIGQFTYDGVNQDFRPFAGDLDDLGIWNRVLSSDEIQYLYQNNYKP